jgi:hypothetical protein
VTRSDFQKLAEERITDAEALLRGGRFGGAYYFSGLAVECALKACVSKKTNVFDFPDLKRAENAYKHDLAKLVETAELKTTLDQQMVASSRFKVNWNTVKQWRIDTRYDPSVAQSQAQELFASVTENIYGVLTWLRTVW